MDLLNRISPFIMGDNLGGRELAYYTVWFARHFINVSALIDALNHIL